MNNNIADLTPREKEIAQYIQNGYTSAKIAEELGISRRTVEVHRANILHKFGYYSIHKRLIPALVALVDGDGTTG